MKVLALILSLFLVVACGEDEAVAPPFRVVVEPEITGHQGADTLLRITLERDAAFTEPVTVSLPTDGVSFQAESVVFSQSMTYAYLRIAVSSEAAVADAALSVLATAGPATVTSPFMVSVLAADLFAQEKIEAARLEGTIDDGTALLYRGYAIYSDPRLPEEYRGAGSFEEDTGLIADINAALPDLPDDLQAQIEELAKRPSDPGSWHNAGTMTATSGKFRTAAGGLPSACPEVSAEQLSSNGFAWISQRSGSHPVRVWTSCLGDSSYQAQSTQLITEALAVVDKAYPAIRDLMGDPIVDDAGGDEAIDIYIDRGPAVLRQGTLWRSGLSGNAFPATPIDGTTTSGFVVIPETTFGSSRFHMTIIHELFHVFQFRYNAFIGTDDGKQKHWFYEASATWAAAYFDQEMSFGYPRGAYASAHARFANRFQKSLMGLNDMDDLHSRSAYIWPYFLEQVVPVGAKIVGEIWTNMEGATLADADDVIDTAHPFDAHFREFALRNVNEELIPGDPLPKDQRHIADDPEFRDDGAKPDHADTYQIAAEVSHETYELNFEPLSARYLNFEVTNTDLTQFVFVLPDAAAWPGLDIDVLVRKNGTWESAPRDLNGMDKLELCEPVDEVRFILSNHDYLPGQFINTTLDVTASTSGCQSTWTGTATHLNGPDGNNGTMRLDADVTWVFDPDQSGPGVETYYAEGYVTVSKTGGDCTYDFSPATVPIVNDHQSFMSIYPDGSGGFYAQLYGLTIWDVTLTVTCPSGGSTATEQFAANWAQSSGQVPLSADGNTITGTAGITGYSWEFSFTR